MTWLEYLHNPKTLIFVLTVVFTGGATIGRAEIMFRFLKKKNETQDQTILTLAQTLERIEASKMDKNFCDTHIAHQQEMMSKTEKAVEKIEQWSRTTSQSVARLEGKLERLNGSAK